MTQNFRSFALLSLCGLSACTNLNAVDSAVGGAQPEALRPPSEAWTDVVSARVAARARALRRADDGSFVAAMPMSRASARLTAEGVTLSGDAELELRLAAFGRDGAVSPLGSADPVEGDCVSGDELGPEGDCVRAIERQHPGLTEWWVGLDDGVEQGFTLNERPEGEGELRIDLAVDGGLGLDTDGETAWLYDGDGAAWTVSELAAWDANGEPLPARFERDGQALRVLVDDAGAVYPVVVDPVYSIVQTFTASNPNGGYSVAGVGDLNGDGFDDVAIGAPGTISSGSSVAGEVYIFPGASGTMYSSRGVTITGPSTAGNFGYTVSAGGDIDNDGYPDLLVGAPYPTSSNGTVYVYWGSSGAFPSSSSVSTIAGPAVASKFGASVAGLGDINRDGYDDFAVGAPGYSSSRGRVQIYYGAASSVTVTNSSNVDSITGALSGDMLGASVAAAGSVNGDSYMDLIVGVPGYSNGRALIYTGGRSGLSSSASVTLSAPSSSSDYGAQVAGLGDVNGDGFDDVAVSDAGYNGNHGVVYVHRGGSSGTSSSYTRLSASSISSRGFGISVAGVGDLNADGYDDFVVSATTEGASSGVVEIYHGSNSGGSTSAADQLTGTGGDFGFSVAGVGDTNADGYADFAVGSPSRTGGTVKVYRGMRDDDRDGIEAGVDCDDNDSSVGDADRYWLDADGDGYGSGDSVLLCPDQVSGYSTQRYDCDDSDPALHPGAEDLPADGIDSDCNGYESCYIDSDGDGAHQADEFVWSDDSDCDDAGESYGTGGIDCDDLDSSVHPNAEETVADGFDQDCDGKELCYTDADLDGFRSDLTAASASLSCDEPGFAAADDAAGDCDDDDSAVYPGAAETIGDGIDSDCDGRETCFLDADSDGFRPNDTAAVESDDTDCDDPGEAIAIVPVGDCDDSLAQVFPGGTERPSDGIDGDCDGSELCYLDEDGDGFTAGDVVPSAQMSCADVAGLSVAEGDCNDELAVISPAATEEPGDGIDQDCDGSDESARAGKDSGCGGCSTQSDAPPAGLLSLFGLLFLRRRR